MDDSYGGGGWTLVAVSSDDGTDTWTWDNRIYWESADTTFGSLDFLDQDFRSEAYDDLTIEDLLFVHYPSGVWAQYDGVGDGTTTLGEIIEAVGERNYYLSTDGYEMTDGTLSTSGTRLCSTNLVFNACGQDARSSCNTDNDDSHGPTWSVDLNHGCPYDEANYGALGTSYNTPSSELDTVGFGAYGGLNTGASGTGENRMEIYIR